MLTANGIHHNGSNGNGVSAAQLYSTCPSDYEARPTIDVTPASPKPGWRDQFPAFTHNLSWIDSEGCSHSMTLRSDSLSDLMGELKLLKAMIRQAKGKAAVSTPQQAVPEPDADVPPCRIHGVQMERRTSKRTGGIYFSHRLPGSKELCFGRAPKA